MTSRPSRVTELLDEINRFGALEDGGVERLAWSPPEIGARAWVADRARELGLEVSYDEAGNVWAMGGGGPAVVMGSHLDTVPRAGRFDGALGIAAALDALGAAGEGDREGRGLVCFTDEEGVRFGLGMMGSRAVAGSLTPEEVARARDDDGAALTEVMSAAGFDPARVGAAAARRERVSAYLELHVEQGRRLERAGVALGVVASIAGLRQWRIEVRGETNHAGTTAPDDRRDALQPAAALILEAQRTMTAAGNLVATVGDVSVDGGAPNVIPGRVSCVLDVRSPSEEALTRAADEILGSCATAARRHRCELEVSEKKRFAPVAMDPRIVEALRDAAAAECGDPPLLDSMAGHDGMNLGRAGVPCGMLFVRSIGGISHSSRELSRAEDCAAGARALGAAAANLARRA
jgi:hydantoinase/carbamoylase family amidase